MSSSTRPILAAVVALVVLTAGCGSSDDRAGPAPTEASSSPSTSGPEPGERSGASPAVWKLADRGSLQASTRSVDVLVARIDCNSGLTGKVLEPHVLRDDTEIVITFEVSPKIEGAATCQSNDLEPYVVDLGEALGDRTLVDGQCAPGGPAEALRVCDPRRWE
ncbi:hypothetical protein ACHAAC_06615 [Aeromicrobium sp. CF4.19]|uniref:hypothetical protein n=1 Tax=Aeromicrobium sp. CF4.19 TaxID=3373082 RepID=UPI003EE58E9C